MTTSLINLISQREYLTTSYGSIFSMERFRRYRGATFFDFSKIAPVPHDLWHHNYHKKNSASGSAYILKISYIDRTYSCRGIFFFILIRSSVVLVELWCHNEGTDDIIIKPSYSPLGVLGKELRFNFFHWAVWEIYWCKFFLRWCPYHVTYDVIIMNKKIIQAEGLRW